MSSSARHAPCPLRAISLRLRDQRANGVKRAQQSNPRCANPFLGCPRHLASTSLARSMPASLPLLRRIRPAFLSSCSLCGTVIATCYLVGIQSRAKATAGENPQSTISLCQYAHDMSSHYAPPRARHVGYSLAFPTVCPFSLLPPRANLDKACCEGLDFEGAATAQCTLCRHCCCWNYSSRTICLLVLFLLSLGLTTAASATKTSK